MILICNEINSLCRDARTATVKNAFTDTFQVASIHVGQTAIYAFLDNVYNVMNHIYISKAQTVSHIVNMDMKFTRVVPSRTAFACLHRKSIQRMIGALYLLEMKIKDQLLSKEYIKVCSKCFTTFKTLMQQFILCQKSLS